MLLKIGLFFICNLLRLVLGQLNFNDNGTSVKNPNNNTNNINIGNFSTRSVANNIQQERDNGLIANLLMQHPLGEGPVNTTDRSPTTITAPTTTNTNEGLRPTNGSGLLANLLMQHPLGDGPINTAETGPTSETTATGPTIEISSSFATSELVCCCAPDSACPSSDSEFYDTRTFNTPKEDLSIRVVNLDVEELEVPAVESGCPSGSTECCYTSRDFVTNLGSQCTLRGAEATSGSGWRQSCPERVPPGAGKKCGQRNFEPLPGLKVGDASPDEFPWTCLVLTGNDDFVAGCAIIPQDIDNDISQGTTRVITVAHRLTGLKKNEVLKVRVQEYDATGFVEGKEKKVFQEYRVVRLVKHPDFAQRTVYNNIALLVLESPIILTQSDGINAACLPSCNDMFDYKFENGTGTRCWVAGWGKTDYDANFSFVQRKADLPIVDRVKCQNKLSTELKKKNGPRSLNFQLQDGELCAGAERGKDACQGDGGAPLVCQSESGLWHVVGLVSWGIGCAQADTPGVYVNVFHYLDFVTEQQSPNSYN